jgi:hypothetical protein
VFAILRIAELSAIGRYLVANIFARTNDSALDEVHCIQTVTHVVTRGPSVYASYFLRALRSAVVPLVFPAKILYALLTSLSHAICIAYHIVLALSISAV